MDEIHMIGLIPSLYKLAFASFIGMILGLERELRRKPLGLKTSMVICIISCLVTIVSIEAAYVFPKEENITMDPLRLAAQIISGIGFLGAGVIMVKGITVTGLTTAAMIWGASGLGIAIGAGFWKESSIALLFMILCVEVVPFIFKRFGPVRLREKEFELIVIIDDSTNIESLQKMIKEKEIIILQARITDLATKERKLIYVISTYEKRSTTNIYEEIRSINGVKSVDISTIGT